MNTIFISYASTQKIDRNFHWALAGDEQVQFEEENVEREQSGREYYFIFKNKAKSMATLRESY